MSRVSEACVSATVLGLIREERISPKRPGHADRSLPDCGHLDTSAKDLGDMETSAVRVDSESHAPRCLCSATQTLSGIRDTAAVTSLGVTKGDDEETKKQKAAASAEADRHMQIMRDRKPRLSIS
ncbi:hypothetical protein Purlil1_10729 [Purpureocillium lilacinum]|uniref:Uncharacterized protein n=1 Tax=Purpureocillium lilacinum TaxID=33203 RepID=A0ABR0BLK3_PURLI|nr:hypothetical protein Purlil1_10729 [Purpureocillium lilacinum]